MRFVWNEGLGLLLEYHHHKYYQWLAEKLGEGDFRKCYLRFSKKNAFAASCPIAVGKKAYPLSTLDVPQSRLKYDNYKGLAEYITKTRYADRPQLKGVPAKFIAGTLKHLAEAWKAYKDKKRSNSHIPKFKSKLRGDKITSLYCIQPENITVLENTVKCPGSKILGELKLVNHGLAKRWDYTVQARTLQIVKRPSGYYLQLAGHIPIKPERPANKACGLDVGLQYIYSDDVGKQIDPPKPATKNLLKSNRITPHRIAPNAGTDRKKL